LYKVKSIFKNYETQKLLFGIVYFYYKNLQKEKEDIEMDNLMVNFQRFNCKKKKINYKNVDEFLRCSITDIGIY
jgi:hypothetical protein